MIQDETVGDFGESAKPVHQTAGQRRCALPEALSDESCTPRVAKCGGDILLTKASQEGTGLIIALV